MSKVDKLFDELKKTESSGERDSVLYLLKARIASGLENQEDGSEDLKKTGEEAWIEAYGNMNRMVEEDPDKALRLGLILAQLPENQDQKLEGVYKWTRGDGLVLLAKEGLRKHLTNYFETDPEGGSLVETMRRYLRFDLRGIEKSEIFLEPRCFLAVVTMYLGTKLEGINNEQAQSLSQLVKERLKDDKIAEVVRHYSGSKDTTWLVTELEPFLPEKE
ncbi:MAG: hypothetical protein UX61_C0001G0025 [Parcubacteria group bacterium GW2011_GWA2_46_7]|nr:MAG: hypothetical protein UX61_C0001G0025 [Parcubacteria group bacterium GW2011_GWA2_46_7]KKU47288.1 MAG: hypothetical protein UX66_C0018G0010 [Parcubacteria group bacterium GW2011_GWF2_46_8]